MYVKLTMEWKNSTKHEFNFSYKCVTGILYDDFLTFTTIRHEKFEMNGNNFEFKKKSYFKTAAIAYQFLYTIYPPAELTS